MDACCAVHGNGCGNGCDDHASSSSWLFGLWPGPPQRFDPKKKKKKKHIDTDYQPVKANWWPTWGLADERGSASDLAIGTTGGAPGPGGSYGMCDQGGTYHGTGGEICGGDRNWGATGVEVWYPR